MTNADDQRIAEIEARCEAATPGPWYLPLYGYSIEADSGKLFHAFGMGEQVNADMRFVAASREDIPVLLAEVDRLTAENERLLELTEKYSNAADAANIDKEITNAVNKQLTREEEGI